MTDKQAEYIIIPIILGFFSWLIFWGIFHINFIIPYVIVLVIFFAGNRSIESYEKKLKEDSNRFMKSCRKREKFIRQKEKKKKRTNKRKD